MKENVESVRFFEIPGYRKYVVSKSGVVIDKLTKRPVRCFKGSAGYYNYRLYDDSGKGRLWGRHRLLMYVFSYPGEHYKGLVVNHLNAVKGDDRLENLEWTTQQANIEHSGALGQTSSCVPISVRNARTGEVTKFASMIKCAAALGISKDAVSYRSFQGETRVWSDGYQYRTGLSNDDWYEIDNVDLQIELAVNAKPILLRDIDTDETTKISSLAELCIMLDLHEASTSIRLNKNDHPILNGKYQVKWLSDIRPWRIIKNLEQERTSFRGSQRVMVTNASTGESTIFNSCRECAAEMGLLVTTLNERLKSGGGKVFRDGFTYCYLDKISPL